jgi:hypothetical protein
MTARSITNPLQLLMIQLLGSKPSTRESLRLLGANESPQGQTHKYLGMSLDFSLTGQCRVTMHDYIDRILHVYDLAIKDHNDGYQIIEKRRAKTSTAPGNLFVVNEDCEKQSNKAAAAFHTVVAKALYFIKRARPDISLAIAFLTTQVRSPNIEAWEK